MVKNYKKSSVDGLSLMFLLNWLLGDICNFAGAMILNQMLFQKAIGAYYVTVDFALMTQYIWYGVLEKGKTAVNYRSLEVVVTDSDSDSGNHEGKPGLPVVIHGVSLSPPESASSSFAGSYASSEFKRKEKRAYSNGSGSWGMGKTAQSMFMFATLVALASALPERKYVSPFATVGAAIDSQPTLVKVSRSEEWMSMDTLGLIIAWVSTSL